MAKRVLFGKLPEGTNKYGLRISKSGYDVTTPNPDNQQLLFNSDWVGILPIHKADVLEITTSGGTATYTHNLGYIPFATALINIYEGSAYRGWEHYSPVNIVQRFVVPASRTYYGKQAQYDQYGNFMGYIYPEKSLSDTFTRIPRQVYATETYNQTEIPAMKVAVTSTQLIFTTSARAKLQYIIYRLKAFS